MSLADQLAQRKARLSKTETVVRDEAGQIYREVMTADGEVKKELISKEILNRFDPDAVAILLPMAFDSKENTWVNAHANKVDRPWKKTEKLSFITYNVWFDSKYQNERAEALFKIIEKYEPDFVCLQECTKIFLDILKEQKWAQKHYYISDAEGVTIIPYGTLILSRHPFNQLKVHSLPSNQGRRFLLADVNIRIGDDIQTLKISTVHLESLANQDVRIDQLTQIFKLLDEGKHNFFMGDMNFGDNRLKNREHHSIPSSYTDAWLDLSAKDPKLTKEYKEGWTIEGQRYDRLLFRSPIFHTHAYQIVGREPIFVVNREEIRPSDHFGVYVELKANCSFSIC